MIIKKFIIAILILFSAHCTKPTPFNELQTVGDPWQKYNRFMFKVNDKIDSKVYLPLAKGWVRITPDFLRSRLHDFLMNAAEPYTTVNLLFQGRIADAHASWARLFTNTTIGVFGFWDAASYFGAPNFDEDFGQTLASWGVGNGPYIVLPLLGPSNLRDTAGFVTHVLSPVSPQDLWSTKYDVLYYTIYGLDIRVRFIGTEEMVHQQVDPYSFVKNFYIQNRANAIYDSIEIPKEDEEDFLDFLDEQ